MTEIELIEQLLQDSSAVVMKYFRSTDVEYTKQDALDPVTAADIESNQLIVDAINKQFPNDRIISEEFGEEAGDDDRLWIIDPLDGTTNFSRGTAVFGMAIAFVKNNQVEASGMAVPVTDDIYIARRGGGATCNGKPLQCSNTPDLTLSYGTVSANLDRSVNPYIDTIIDASRQTKFWINAFGCAVFAAAELATGRRDWQLGAGGKLWDYAPQSLILEEAGCTLTAIDGTPWTIDTPGYVAANPTLHKKLVILLGPA